MKTRGRTGGSICVDRSPTSRISMLSSASSKARNMPRYPSLSLVKTVKYGSSYVRGAYMAGLTYDYSDVTKLEYSEGRYFTPFEYEVGANRVILGYELASELFQGKEATGREVKIMGQKFKVIGVLKKEGNSLINIFEYDEAVLIGYNTAKKTGQCPYRGLMGYHAECQGPSLMCNW